MGRSGVRGGVASALSAVSDWLVEPAAPLAEPALPSSVQARPVIVVTGLHANTGVTVVARALAVELAGRDPAGVAVVTAGTGSAGLSLGLPAATRMSRSLAPLASGGTCACGRLCLVRGADERVLAESVAGAASLVLDVAEPAEAPLAAAGADGVVIVAGPGAEPALAGVVAESLERTGPVPLVVRNRCGALEGDWQRFAHVALPESRLAARAATSGHPARAAFGQAIAAIADHWVARP